MQTIMKSDIFFVVTTIAVVAVAIALVVAIVYLILILKDVKSLSEKIKDEGGKIVEDVGAIRLEVKEKSKGISSSLIKLFSFVTSFGKKDKRD